MFAYDRTRRQQMVSSEDDDGYPGPGRRPSFGPFSQGFSQGPPQYRYAPDAPSGTLPFLRGFKNALLQ